MQSEKAAVIRRRRRNLKNRDYAGSSDYSYTPEAVEKTAGGWQREASKSCPGEKYIQTQLQSVCKKQFVRSLVSPMYIVMSFRCVLRKRLGKDLKNVDILPCRKNGKERERKETNSLYALNCLLKTVQKRTRMTNKSQEKRISVAKEELKTITKQRDFRATNQNIYSFMRLLNQNSLK